MKWDIAFNATIQRQLNSMPNPSISNHALSICKRIPKRPIQLPNSYDVQVRKKCSPTTASMMQENLALLAKSVTFLCKEKAALIQKVEELEHKVEAVNKAAKNSRANEVKTNKKLQELTRIQPKS